MTTLRSRRHQAVAGEFLARLRDYVKAHRIGRTFHAPGDVHIDSKNQVQPDLFVEPRRASGPPKGWKDAMAPILVVEILSDGTAWRAAGAVESLVIDLPALFRDALDD